MRRLPDVTPANAQHSLELDSERAREIAERGLILRTTVGSVVHGLSNPGTDDRDEMGVCIEPPEYLLGFRRFEHFVYRTQPEGVQSGPGDLDLTVYQGIELLQTGRITLPMGEPERSALRDVRAGRVPLDEVLSHLERVTARLAEVAEAPGVATRPDVAAVDAFVVRAYRRAWDAGLSA